MFTISEGVPCASRDTGPWFVRDERLYLFPGDSPMGYRLPLDSLPWTSATDYPYIFPPDPAQPLPPLAMDAIDGWQMLAQIETHREKGRSPC